MSFLIGCCLGTLPKLMEMTSAALRCPFLTDRNQKLSVQEGADDEARALAQWIKDLIKRGYQPNQIAILGRTKRAVESRARPAIESSSYGLPVAITGQRSYGWQSITWDVARSEGFGISGRGGCRMRRRPCAASISRRKSNNGGRTRNRRSARSQPSLRRLHTCARLSPNHLPWPAKPVSLAP